MIVIVLVCIAPAGLLAWLMLEHGRWAIGDFRPHRSAIGLLRAPASRITSPPEPPEASPPVGEDVEQRVRDRLYGERNGALRRAPAAND